jgi:hypothetical protein
VPAAPAPASAPRRSASGCELTSAPALGAATPSRPVVALASRVSGGTLRAPVRPGAQAVARLTSALALGTAALPRLWAWLARAAGLPLEAPADATRGWDIASLRRGVAGLPPEHARALGLFARLLATALQAYDDEDFYEAQVRCGAAGARRPSVHLQGWPGRGHGCGRLRLAALFHF